jgi:hypothetical protein
MKFSRKVRPAGTARRQAGQSGASVVIDLSDLLEASKEDKVRALLHDAETEGARVAREGRKRW